MYDTNSQKRLQEKADYEIWLLDFLSETLKTFEGDTDISTITLVNRQRGAHVDVHITEVLGAGAAMEVKNAISPLTFAATYKTLDMIFEWILEENVSIGNIKEVPWRFSEKIEMISKNYNKLVYPPIFRSIPYIRDYLFALYSNLLKFRNEVVHKHSFSVSSTQLKIETEVDVEHYNLVLDRVELGAFVRTVVAAVNFLTGVLPLGRWEERLLKFHIDQIQKLHNLKMFGQAKPLLINVVLKVPAEKRVYPANLEFVRQEIRRIHRDADALFNLKVVGLVNGKPSVCWYFPANSVPDKDVFELHIGDYEKYRVSL